MRRGVGLAGFWILLVAGFSLLAPLFLREMAQAMDFSALLEPPSFRHLLGTDSLGRDLLSRLLCGSRVSLGVAVLSIGFAVLIGVMVGACAGYYGGWRDKALMAFVDVMLCFPVFFLILSVIAVLGPNVWNVAVVIGLTNWMGTARLIRAEILSLKEREFVLASRALGAGDFWIIGRHLVPNAMGPVIVNAVLGLASAVLIESSLSFLGIGVQPPTPSWGNILMDGRAALGAAWWLVLFPGIMIFLTVLSVNVLGEELRRWAHGADR
ncbi:MAG: ABC transporter permease [Candidatus Omnitrophica bacterium]|nr:ABC transporter permease [Candidatus Omnitrophota bacterium]